MKETLQVVAKTMASKGIVNLPSAQTRFWQCIDKLKPYLTEMEHSKLLTAHSHATDTLEGCSEFNTVCTEILTRLSKLKDWRNLLI